MKISVVGCGYLGAVHAACMAELGHDVLGIDIDETKVAALSAGRTGPAPSLSAPSWGAAVTVSSPRGSAGAVVASEGAAAPPGPSMASEVIGVSGMCVPPC